MDSRASASVHAGVALEVPPQVVQAGVGLGADLAVVRPHPRVIQHVLLQHAAVGEGLAALRAHVRLLARVHTHMHRHLVRHGEALAAQRALERPLASVRESVRAHGAHLREGLAAVGAHVRLLACVHPRVALEPTGRGEALRAVGALVRPLARVRAHVLLEVVAVPEAAAAHRAVLGPVVAVPLLVVGQALFGQEALAALLALVWLVVVHSLVVLKLADAGERLVAVATAESVVGTVGQLVLAHLVVPQQVGHLEVLAAVGALVFGHHLHALVPDALVEGPELAAALGADVRGVFALALTVAGEVRLRAEGLATLRALVRLDGCVEPLVLQELKAILEAPAALRTVVGDACARVGGLERVLPGGQGRRGAPVRRANFPVLASADQFAAVDFASLLVPLLVLDQTSGGDEALPTLLALIRLVVVDLLMVLELTDAGETVATVAALEEATLDVRQQVLLQAARLLEALPAVRAFVALPPLGALVSELLQGRGKTVPAFDAQVCRIFALAQPVAGQQGGGAKGPAAFGAVVGLQSAVNPLVLDENRVVLEALVALGTLVHARLLLPPRGWRGIILLFRGVGEVGGRGSDVGVCGELLLEHDDMWHVVVLVVAAVGRDGDLQRGRQRHGGDEKIVRMELSNASFGQFPVALFALEKKLEVIPVGHTLHVVFQS